MCGERKNFTLPPEKECNTPLVNAMRPNEVCQVRREGEYEGARTLDANFLYICNGPP